MTYKLPSHLDPYRKYVYFPEKTIRFNKSEDGFKSLGYYEKGVDNLAQCQIDLLQRVYEDKKLR